MALDKCKERSSALAAARAENERLRVALSEIRSGLLARERDGWIISIGDELGATTMQRIAVDALGAGEASDA